MQNVENEGDEENETGEISATQNEFQQQLSKAVRVLVRDLDLDSNRNRANELRLYKFQVLQIHSDVSLLLVGLTSCHVCELM